MTTLADIRIDRGHSYADAARATGLAISQIQRIESGASGTWRTLRAAARYYGYTLGQLCELLAERELGPDS